MGTLLVQNANIVSDHVLQERQSVFCADGRIVQVFPAGLHPGLTAGETVDASGRYLAPGFVDLHCHGARGFLIDRGPGDLAELCRVLPQYGVTGFLPTVCPAAVEEDEIGNLAAYAGGSYVGAAILGFFLEGHFLSLTGAIPGIPRNKSRERVEQLTDASKPYPAVFGISPEVEGIVGLLPVMTRQGYPAFITHTGASAEQTEQAIQAGAVHATHFYDVFPYPGEKDPGVRTCGAVEAILANPQASVDFILDGEHVDPVAVKMALVCKGRDKVCLITDANVCAGLPPGSYEAFGSEIEVAYAGGPARMGQNSRFPGALAGSGLTMDLAVRNAVRLLGIPLPLAIAMASANPSRVLGLQERKGSILPGFDADFILLDCQLQVTACWVGGTCRYQRGVDGQIQGRVV